MKLTRQNTVRLTGVLLAVMAVAALAIGLFSGGRDNSVIQPAEEVQQTAAGADETSEKTVSTVAYYGDGNGHIVPVMRKIPDQDGVARATLQLMVKNETNDREAARMGLSTLLPENCSIDIDINADGVARVDLGKEANAMPDAASESNMVAGVVAALGEFPTVKQVEFLIGGQKLKKLKHGTDISKPIEPGAVNLESAESVSETFSADQITLYFPDESGRLMVPVTRMVYGEGDINTAVLELAKGSNDKKLENALPEGCGLIGVNVKDGVATINFTREFIEIAEKSDGGRAALKALVLTCTQFKGVKSVEIQVEGEKYDPGKQTLSVPTFANVAEDIPTMGYAETAAILEFD